MPNACENLIVITRCCQRIAILFILSVGWLIPSISTGQERLEITGFVDRPMVEEGDPFHLVVNIVNTGEEAVKLTSVKTTSGPDAPCRNFAPTQLPSNQTLAVSCPYNLAKNGQYNVGVQISWSVNGKSHQSVAKNIAKVEVLPARRATSYGFDLMAAAAVVLLLIIAATVTKRMFSLFATVSVLLLAISVITLLLGLWFQNGTIVIAALILLAAVGILILMGEDFITGLIQRVLKVGPVEFAPLTAKTLEADIFKLRESNFLQRQTTIDGIIKREEKIDYYIEFLWLRAYSLESDLIPYATTIPPDALEERISWMNQLRGGNSLDLGEEFFHALEGTYKEIKNHVCFKNLFDSRLKNILQAAAGDGKQQKEKVRQAIETLTQARSDLFSPHFFVLLARLQLVLREPHCKARALSFLYEGYSHFADSVKINSPLAEYIGELNNDFWSALKHDCRALEIATRSEKEMEEQHTKINSGVAGAPTSPLAVHLKKVLSHHDARWNAKLCDWFQTLQKQMMNAVACDIAYGELAAYENLARDYAKRATEAEPENPAYADTLALVKFRFANTPSGGKDKEIREAATLFEQAIYMARDKEDELTLEEARLHFRQAVEALMYK